MLTLYASIQRTHRQAYVLKQGAQADSWERPERIDSILSALHEARLGPVLEPEDGGLAPVYAVHDEGMVAFLATAYAQQQAHGSPGTPVFPTVFPAPGQRRRPDGFEGRKGYYCVDMEVPIEAQTWEAALASAHCAWTGAMRLRAGEPLVYALCRPPGHHAGPDFMGGYCYLNNAAIAARALGAGGEGVALLDVDYHHGNGTQAVFYADPGVWYGSLHVDPRAAYPFYAGYEEERGDQAGQGTNWNVPLPPGTGPKRYLSALDALLERLCAYDPRWIVVSAGLDTYRDDPIGTFQLSTDAYCEMGARIRALGRPTLVVQEGGYYLPDLGRNVVALLQALGAS
jgi:acetoin utilization deacetylase AcuC-like enzyme